MRTRSLLLLSALAWGCGDKDDTGVTDEVDADGDGYAADVDCDDDDASVNPGAEEACDGVDNNCDGTADDGLDTVTYYADTDGDGDGDPARATDACAQPAGYVTSGGDCDDSDASISSAAEEVCDGVDNDCDSLVDDDDDSVVFDDGPEWFADADGDGYGDPKVSGISCAAPTGYILNSEDCDDGDAAVYPGAAEVCDGQHNDCDSTEYDPVAVPPDEADDDGDGHVECAYDSASWAGSVSVTGGSDCDDADIATFPGAAEACDGQYNDCDDPSYDAAGAPSDEVDGDGDRYVDCAYDAAAWVGDVLIRGGDDCDDGDAVVYPGASEVCDGQYNDCSDSDYTAAGAPGDETDGDGDGYVACAYSGSAWVGPSGVVGGDDCDDAEAAAYPGAAEVCDSIDNDCDGDTDDADSSLDTSTASTWYGDGDGDGYGDASDSTVSCDAPSGTVSDNTDCDDGDAVVYPAAAEVCDGQYNDCSDTGYDASGAPADEADDDADGYVECAHSSSAWTGSTSVVGGDDCDDGDDSVYPSAAEVCDGQYNDCSATGYDASGAPSDEVDGDSDRYVACDYDAASWVGDVLIRGGDDCDDTEATVYPGAAEVCDGQFNDCDDTSYDASGAPDDEVDGDADGYVECAYSSSAWAGSTGVVGGDDCDDADDTAYPGALEYCDEVDNDCDEDTDEAFVDESFDGSFSGLSVNGDAAHVYYGSDGYIELTSTSPTYQAGSVMVSADVPGDIWYASFDIYIGDGTGSTAGADGMAFVFYDADVADTYVGASGSYLGAYNTSYDGYGIEFDVYDSGTVDNDYDGNHIAVIDTSAYPFVDYGYDDTIPTLETSSTNYTVEVYFLEGDIDVYIDDTLYISTTITDYALDSLRMGWTAGTGGLTNYHTVDDVYVGCY